jgi:DNA (cytosine-5)-methyltransferase 1
MPTPKALDGEKGNLKSSQERLDAGRQVDLPNIAVDLVQPIELFGTVTTATSGRSSEFRGNGTNVVEFAEEVAEKLNNLSPTPQVDDSKNTGHNQDRRLTLASEVWETERTTSWGKFEPAIRRWEEVLGRPAPAPTKPDGKDGAHRLSSKFTEWMMGLPDGWITDCGLSRNEELKACGNGVVPQQAELALRMLLDGIDLRVGGASDVSDTNSF